MKPYEETIDILRAALRQAEHDLSMHPTDSKAIELRNSLRRMLADLESDHVA